MKRQSKTLLGIILGVICVVVLVATPRPTLAGQDAQAGTDAPIGWIHAKSVADLFPRGR